MIEQGLAVAVALFAWWFSTGAILFLNQLPQRTFPWSMAAATLVAGVAVWAILATLEEITATSAYIGFLGGLALWGWHELSFLTGFVTGPRRVPCPEGASGWRRFLLATATLITHEFAILLTVLALVALSMGEANPTALITFTSLWLLRLSAKFNIFLGIPNLTVEFLPAHMDYLKTYFRNRPMNPLFPVSITAGTVLALVLIHPAFDPAAGAFQQTAALLIGTLVALGVLEHWLMVLPLPDAALWRWAMLSDPTTENDTIKLRDTPNASVPALQKFELKPSEAEVAPLAPALMGGKP